MQTSTKTGHYVNTTFREVVFNIEIFAVHKDGKKYKLSAMSHNHDGEMIELFVKDDNGKEVEVNPTEFVIKVYSSDRS